MLEWISEADEFPQVGQEVLFASKRMSDDIWRIKISHILIRHEGVVPHGVSEGDKSPTDFYWCSGSSDHGVHLITGTGWWASMSTLSLPPGAQHKKCPIAGYDYVTSDSGTPTGASE